MIIPTKDIVIIIVLVFVVNCVDRDARDCSSVKLIRVKQIHPGKNCVFDRKGTRCPNLTLALMQKDLNDTRIEILEPQKLTSIAPLVNVHNLAIIGNSFVCNCTKSNIGFSFVNSSNITFSGIIITKCGRKYLSTASPPEGTNLTPYISTALYFNYTTNLSLLTTAISESMGYAVTMYDCDGYIEFDKCEFSKNNLVPFFLGNDLVIGYASGGGVYAEHTSNNTVVNSTMKFTQCKFYSNTGEMKTSFAYSENQHIPFGRGVGIALFFLGGSHGNTVFILNATFNSNEALWGTALHIMFGGDAWSINITVLHSTFNNNVALMSGGAVRVVFMREISQSNLLTFINTTFSGNSAVHGGAFSQYRKNLVSFSKLLERNETVFKHCKFHKNKAIVGAALYIDDSSIFFFHLNMTQNLFQKLHHGKKQFECLGAIYAYRSDIKFNGNNHISGNSKTAVVLDYSSLTIFDTLIFSGNSGTKGGAMALYQHSRVMLKSSSNLIFYKNIARKGGAMFVSEHLPPHTDMPMFTCFFQCNNNNCSGKISFVKNIALIDGSAIYATTLRNCRGIGKTNDIFTNGTSMHFSQGQIISTYPVKIIVHKDDWKDVWPGKSLRPRIHLIDENNNSISSTVDISFEPNGVISIENGLTRLIVNNQQIKLTLLASAQIPNFNITISAVKGIVSQKKIQFITLSQCPFGYFFTASLKKCVCSSKQNQDRGIAHCIGNDIYIFKHLWIKPNQPAEREKVLRCPGGYCYDKCYHKDYMQERLGCIYQENNQCREGRDQLSILCGQCEKNKSVAFGSSTCKDCTNTSQFVIFLIVCGIVGALTIIVLLILWSNFDVFDNYLNGVLFFYQVAHLLKTTTQEYDSAMTVLSGIMNMSGLETEKFHGFCFFDGFNDLYKMLFNYVIAFVMLMVLLIVTIVGSFKRDFYFNRANCFRAFVFVMMLAYNDITRVTFNLINKVVVDDLNNEDSIRLYIFGGMKFFHGQHLIIGVFAIVVLVIFVIGFPLLLVLSPVLLSTCCVEFKPIFDSFSYAFKDTVLCQAFTSYYFVCRGIMLALYVSTDTDQTQLTSLTTICIFVLLIFSLVQPYKEDRINYFDMMVLTNLAVVAILCNGRLKLYLSDPADRKLFILIRYLMWPPLIAFIFCFLWKKLSGCFQRAIIEIRKFSQEVPRRVLIEMRPARKEYERL